MPKEKQYVFSARTTEEGLKVLNAKKAELGVGWDDLVIGAVNAHYGVDVPKAQRAERPKREPKAGAKRPRKGPRAEAKEAKAGNAEQEQK